MHIQIDISDNAERERLFRLFQFSLSGQRADIDSVLLSIKLVHDTLGTRLNRCRLQTRLKCG